MGVFILARIELGDVICGFVQAVRRTNCFKIQLDIDECQSYRFYDWFDLCIHLGSFGGLVIGSSISWGRCFLVSLVWFPFD